MTRDLRRDDQNWQKSDFAKIFQSERAENNFNDFSPVPYQYMALPLEQDDSRDQVVKDLIAQYLQEIAEIKSKESEAQDEQGLQRDGEILANIVTAKLSDFAVFPDFNSRFNKYIRDFYGSNKYDAIYFCENFLKTLYFISHDQQGQILGPENIENEFRKFSSVINFTCFGGAISAVNEYYESVRFPASFWVDLRSQLAVELSRYCAVSSERHLPSWLDYVALGNRGRDNYFYLPSFDMNYGQINDFLNKMSFGISDIFIKHYDLCRRCYDVLQKTRAEGDELYGEIFNLFNGDKRDKKYEVADEILRKINLVELVEEVRGQEYEAVLPKIAAEIKSAINVTRNLDNEEFNDENYQRFFCDLIEALNVVKVYAMKGSLPQSNKFVPWWLQDKILDFANRASNFGFLASDFFEKKTFAEQIIFLAQEAERIGGYKINFEHDSIKVGDNHKELSLQELLDYGADSGMFWLIPSAQKFSLDITGLLFHPQQQEIISFLERQGHQLNYNKMLENALLQGDYQYVASTLPQQEQSLLNLLNDKKIIRRIAVENLIKLNEVILQENNPQNKPVNISLEKEIAIKYLNEKNFNEAVAWLDSVARKGDADAQISLAVIYQNSVFSNPDQLSLAANKAIEYYNLYYQNPDKEGPKKVRNLLSPSLDPRALAFVSEQWFEKALQIWNSDQQDVSEVVAFVEHMIVNELNGVENQEDLRDLVEAVFDNKCWPTNSYYNFLRVEYDRVSGHEDIAILRNFHLATFYPLYLPALRRLLNADVVVLNQILSPQQISLLNEKIRDYLGKDPASPEMAQLSSAERLHFTKYIINNGNDNLAQDSVLIDNLQKAHQKPYSMHVNRVIAKFCQKYQQYELWTKTCLEAILPDVTAENYAYEFSRIASLTQIATNDAKADAIFQLAELFLNNRAFKTMPKYLSFDLDIFEKVISFCAQYADGRSPVKSRACAIYGRFLYEGFAASYYNRNIAANPAAAIPYLEQAMTAPNVDPNVINCIATQYYYGGYGYEKNYERALELYEQAAQKGSNEAQYNAGYCYHMKIGTPVDLSDDAAKAKARDYLTQAVRNDAPSKLKAQALLRSLDYPRAGVVVNSAMKVGDAVKGLVR